MLDQRLVADQACATPKSKGNVSKTEFSNQEGTSEGAALLRLNDFVTGFNDTINKMGLTPTASSPKGIASICRQKLQPKVGRLVKQFGGTCGDASLPSVDAVAEWEWDA